MSFDIAVFSAEQPLDGPSAARIYISLCEGTATPIPDGLRSRPEMTSFNRDLLTRYPDIDTLAEADIDGSPWSCAPELTDSYAVMSFVWSRAEEVAEAVQALATRHGLTVFDPGSESVVPPARPRAWQFWRR